LLFVKLLYSLFPVPAWSFAYGPWAIATFIELLLGYGLATEFLLRLRN
jgi:hypothetical protein